MPAFCQRPPLSHALMAELVSAVSATSLQVATGISGQAGGSQSISQWFHGPSRRVQQAGPAAASPHLVHRLEHLQRLAPGTLLAQLAHHLGQACS